MNDRITNHLSTLTQGPQATPPAPAMTRMANSMNVPVKCAECGSEWFYIVSANKYANMYSATPGGDLHALSQEQTFRVCLCGSPFNPNIGGVKGGRTPNATLSDFLQTLDASRIYRGKLAQLVADVSKAATPVEETAALEARIATLEGVVRELAAVPPAPKPEAESQDTASEAAPKAAKTAAKAPAKKTAPVAKAAPAEKAPTPEKAPEPIKEG